MRHTIKNKEDLATAYRILAKLGMDDHTYTHLSLREGDSYYIYPFGLRFEEVRAESLIRVDLEGNILEGEEFQYNQTGYMIHSGIYQHREDVKCVFHLHTISTVAVSAMEEGLLPISQWALHFYNQLAYHAYDSLVLDDKKGKALYQDLGDKPVLFLRNHGFLACGKTIWETLYYCYHLEMACKTQIAVMSSGAKMVIPDKKICENANRDLLGFEEDLGYRDWQAWKRWLDKA